jgi:hypothetical protein
MMSVWIKSENMFMPPYQAGIGGPLFNMRGEVIGMNFYSEKIGTPFLLWNEIGNILAYFKEKWYF